jgi:hypothetical protein
MRRCARGLAAFALSAAFAGTVACSNGATTGTTNTTGTATGTTTGTSGSTGGGSTTAAGSAGSNGTGTGVGTTSGGMPDAGCGCDAGTFCDPADSGACLACLTDANCQAPKAVCETLAGNPNYGKCVACTQAEPTCASGLHCEVDGGQCVECLSPQDCPYSRAGCFHLTFACGYCLDSTDCPAGLTCNTHTRKCLCTDGTQCGGDAPVCVLPQGQGGPDAGSCGCRNSADCVSLGADVCITSQQSPSGACIPSCIDGGMDCSTNALPNQFCNFDSGVCGGCTSDEQCAGNDAGSGCVRQSGRCGCNRTSDCPVTAGCGTGGQCVAACTLDGGPDCSTQQLICDPTSRVCVSCLSDTDCTNAQTPYCGADIDAGNKCVQCINAGQCPSSTPGCNSFFLMCGSCFASGDCPSSAPVCQNFACAQSCVLPDGGEYCAMGVCQSSTGACVTCLQDSDCQGQTGRPFCSNDLDAGTRCVQCLQGSDCPDAGFCNSRFLLCGSCAVDSDCPPDAPTCSNPPFGTCSDGG